METAMRAQRQKVKMLQQGGADPDDVVIAKAKYQAQLQEYKNFCDDMELIPQMQRVYIDSLGRVANGQTIVNSTKGAIIKRNSLYRNKTKYTIEPMPKKQLQKIVKGFKRNGGIIQMNDATDAYLDKIKAEATTYNENTILLRQRPGRAAVYEELIHATQYRKGQVEGSRESILMAEIEAQKKLLKYQKEYKLTEPEIMQTEKALKQYEKELNKLKR